MSSVVFLFGNGLSIGVAPEFAVPAMTERLNSRLEPSMREALVELRQLSTPDLVVPAESQLGFEQLAGPLDRVANAVQVLAPIARRADREDCLHQSHLYLRQRYLSIVGLILDDLASSARLGQTEGWSALNELGQALGRLHREHSTALFTLSYDTLLDSALIESYGGWFYDGFAGPGLLLNQPLDCWAGTMPLYHLHGSVLWYEDPIAGVRKVPSDSDLHRAQLEQWRTGEDQLGFPVVVLTDAKVPAVARHPFDLFYQELWNELGQARVLVIAGYAFGDEPVNRIVKSWLSAPTAFQRVLEVWSQSAERARARFEERIGDVGATRAGPQTNFRSVSLPSPSAVAELHQRL